MSSSADFYLPVRKMSADFATLNNQQSDTTNYDIVGGNIYRNSVTINNTGLSVKSNYLICVQWDTKNLIQGYQLAVNMCDLRVLSSDDVTPLNFYIQGENQTNTCIFVLMPSLPATNTTIYFEYGNPAKIKKSNITNTLGSGLFSNFTLWLRGNEVNVSTNPLETGLQYIWQNQGTKKCHIAQNDGVNTPSVVNLCNNLATMNFSSSLANSIGSSQMYCTEIMKRDFDISFLGGSVSAFCVARGTGSYFGKNSSTVSTVDPQRRKLQLTDSNWRCGSDSQLVTLPTVNTAKFSFIGAVSYSNSSHTLLSDNTTTTSTTTLSLASNDARFNIGAGYQSAEYFDGDIAEVIITTGLNSTEIGQVKNYLNAKYRLYNTSDMPTSSVGAQGNTSYTSSTYLSYASLTDFSSSNSLKNTFYGLSKNESKVKISNYFQKTFASGINQEGWSTSTQYSESDTYQPIVLSYCRTITLVTGTNTDSVTIESINPNTGNNQGDISKFEVVNEVATAIYQSTSNDYICFDFCCDSLANLDVANCWVKFQNVGNTINYYSTLVNNINPLLDGVNNRIQIKKSSFALFGAGSWSDMVQMRVNFQKITGAVQKVYYGNFTLVKNIEASANLVLGYPAKLGVAVSSDDGTTYYNQTTDIGLISQSLIHEDDIQVEFISYFESVKSKKMKELSAFPDSGFLCLRNGTEYTDLVRSLLALVIPSSYLDVQLYMLSEDYPGLRFNSTYFPATGENTFGEVLDRILSACFGYISYSPVDGRFMVRNGYKYLDDTNYTSSSGVQTETPYQISDNSIINYKNDTSDREQVKNYMIVDPYRIYKDHNILGFENNSSTLLTSFADTVIDLDFSSKNTETVSFYPLCNFTVAGYNVADSADSNVYNGFNIYIKNCFKYGNKVRVIIRNDNSANKYLRQISIKATYIVAEKIISYNNGTLSNFSPVVYSDTTSINQYGLREFPASSPWAWISYASSGAVQPLPARLYQSMVNKFKNPLNLIQVELQFDPNVRLGKVVKIRNRQGRNVTGTVIKYDLYANSEFTQNVTIREI
jgi:hypothetical protein